MTEQELASEGWDGAIDFVTRRADARKKQLAFCACCRVTWHLAELECNRAAIEASEAFADGQLPLPTLKRCWNAIRFEPAVYSVWLLGAAGPAVGAGRLPHLEPQTEVDDAALREFDLLEEREIKGWERAWVACASDVFGHELNEFHFEHAWATDTAVALARQMYDSREFGAMPILADALQDAGCDCDAILNHCRDTTRAHARGCWVVDLVLSR